jgi:two-component system cell cycle sensor histidine kinase/response regulator CckA
MSTRQTILIVDQEPGVRKLLARELRPNNEVLLAADGLKAVRIYEIHQEQIAMLLIEPRLPRLDGQAVAEWVHHISPQLPVIFMSKVGFDAAEDFPRSPEVRFVRKPFDLPELKKILRTILDQQAIASLENSAE